MIEVDDSYDRSGLEMRAKEVRVAAGAVTSAAARDVLLQLAQLYENQARSLPSLVGQRDHSV